MGGMFARCLSSVALSPHHFVHDADVALDDFDYLGRYILFDVVGNGDAVIAILVHGDGGVDRLQQALFVDAGNEETGFVEGFRALGAGSDADGGEGMAYAGEETAFLGQRAAVADDGEGVHLETVVVMEAEGLMLDHPTVELEARLLQAFTATGMTAVEDGHVVLLGHLVDGGEEGQEVFLRIDVLLTVGGEEDVVSWGEG